MRTLFEVTPERAASIRKGLGYLTPEERARSAVAERAPSPYIETPDDVKRARADALARRLANAGERKAARS